MNQKSIWRGVLIAIISVALAAPTWADRPRLRANASSGDSFQKLGNEVLIGIVVAAVAVVVVVAILVTHHKPQRITGCVHSEANGMSVTDEKDRQSYALSGSTAGVGGRIFPDRLYLR